MSFAGGILDSGLAVAGSFDGESGSWGTEEAVAEAAEAVAVTARGWSLCRPLLQGVILEMGVLHRITFGCIIPDALGALLENEIVLACARMFEISMQNGTSRAF